MSDASRISADAPAESPDLPHSQTSESGPSGLRRAVVLMTASSFLVPIAGVLSAPLLSQALGVAGRGEVAAALAPNSLLVGVATLGMPEALVYLLARQPTLTARALRWASLFVMALGLVCFGLILLVLPLLSGGDQTLGRLILVGTVLAIPALVLNLLRGAAAGRQMWGIIAAERLLGTLLRLALLLLLFSTGQLTVLNAVIVGGSTMVVAGVVYLKLLEQSSEEVSEPFQGHVGRQLLTFGSRVWIGSVASILLARTSQILIVPLSDVNQLGLYAVAITISDVPFIVALAIRDALYGVNSRQNDAGQLTTVSRATFLLAAVGCSAIGASLPWWIRPVFGADFGAAVGPTLILMGAAVIAIPGIVAAAGLGAWGRPGLRSIGLALTLVVNLGLFAILVPSYGANGAAWAGVVGNVVSTVFMILAAGRVMKVHAATFVRVRRSDVSLCWQEGINFALRRKQ